MKALTLSQRRNARPRSRVSRGELVAQMLAGSWRAAPLPPTNSAQELADIFTLLMKSGSGSLAWNKIRNSELEASRTGQELRQLYRLYSLHAALHEHNIKRIIPMLRGCGVEPLLVKGWAVARLYPEIGLRPYGDLDLCVLPGDYSKAQAALKDSEGFECDVDLHSGFGKFYDRRTEDIFARSRLIRLDDQEVRVLSAEDDLRFLCMHLLRHGAVRPLWLCDIAVLVETRADDFDWDRCLSGPRRHADWVACAVRLAYQLLGADVKGTPVANRAGKLPGWMITAVLEEWGVPFEPLTPLANYPGNRGMALTSLLKELSRHWPNPIEATMTLGGPFNRLPRLPFQVGHIFSRAKALRPVKL